MSGRQRKLHLGRVWDAAWQALGVKAKAPPVRERNEGERCGTCLEFEHHHQDDHAGECALLRRSGQQDIFGGVPYRKSCADWCKDYSEYHRHD